MKAGLAFFVILVAIGLSAQGFLGSRNGSPKYARSEEDDTTSLQHALDEFWTASASGDDLRLTAIQTTVPSDFFARTNECVLASIGTHGDPEQGVHDVGGLGTVDAFYRKGQAATIESLTRRIRFDGYVYYKIRSSTVDSDRAVAEVEYGKNNVLPFVELFLFQRIDGVWKLFMTTLKKDLMTSNRCFVTTQCVCTAGGAGQIPPAPDDRAK